MEAWLTDQWQRFSFWQLLLRPVSWLFRLVVAIRRGAYRAGLLKSHAVSVPVIIVGNISVGGTGKTPLVLALAQLLTKNGRRCGIVTRGYRGYAEYVAGNGVIRVVPVAAESAVVSDEAALLARRAAVPVYVAANRVDAARSLLRSHPEVDVIISDDGLQHYALKRDIELCVIDGARGLGNGELLPAGPLREPASRLKAVDAVIVNRSRGTNATHIVSAGAAFHAAPTPVFNMSLANEKFVNLKSGRCLDADAAGAAFRGLRIHAVAGIGNPQRFFSHLASLGLQATSTQPFPDHHAYVESDFTGDTTEVFMMTEKDAVKCATFADERMWFMRVDAALHEDFTEFILQRLTDRKA